MRCKDCSLRHVKKFADLRPKVSETTLTAPMPGYEIENVIFKDQDLLRKFTCPECNLLLRNAVQLQCGDWLCMSCADVIIARDEESKCPNKKCGKLFQDDYFFYFPDDFVRSEVLCLPASCKFHDKGCDWIGKFGELEGHIETCDFSSVQCNFRKKTLSHNKADTHKATRCPRSPKRSSDTKLKSFDTHKSAAGCPSSPKRSLDTKLESFDSHKAARCPRSPKKSLDSKLELSDVLCEIKRVVRWKQLACHLGIPIDVIECIIQDNKDSTEDQKMKAISWWLENEDATWGKLADALRQTDYRRLSDQILRKYSASSKTSAVSDEVGQLLTEDDSPANGKDEPAKNELLLKVWKIAKAQTAKCLKSLFEKVIKKPLDLIFKRRYKIRKKGDKKQARWWIEIKGDEKDLEMIESKRHKIEWQTGCRLEAKAC